MKIIEKIKNSFFFSQFEVSQYTKRRTNSNNGHNKSSNYYEANYHDGVYLNLHSENNKSQKSIKKLLKDRTLKV
jgi:hypothetical protein